MNLIPKLKLFIDESWEHGKKTLEFLPGEIKKTIEERTWLPLQLRQPLEKAVKFILPESPQSFAQKDIMRGVPADIAYQEGKRKSAEEAQRYGLIQSTTKEGKQIYIDPFMIGGMKQVGPKAAKIVGKTRTAMAAKALAKKGVKEVEAFPIFKGFKDLTTKVLNKLKGRSTVSKQFISDLTNMPDLKQAERNVIRNVLDSYGVKPAIKVKYPKGRAIPDKPVVLYRGGNPDIAGGGLAKGRDVNSWSYSKKVAEGYTENGRYSLYKATIDPEDIWFDYTKSLEHKGGEFADIEEVLVRAGIKGKVIKKGSSPLGKQIVKKQLKPKSINTEDYWYPGNMREDYPDEYFLKSYQPSSQLTQYKNKYLEKSHYLEGERRGITYIDESKKALSIIPKKTTDKIPVQEFANKVKDELLPLKFKTAQKYKSYVLPDESRGNVANYAEHIWESPIKTSAGKTHWSTTSFTPGTAPAIKRMEVTGTPENYFGHTRIEDMLAKRGYTFDEALKELPQEVARKLVYRQVDGQYRHYKVGTTRRVIELQTDLYQKGMMPTHVEAKSASLKRLQQYNDPTAHFRMIREEVKQAALDGKTKLQFPTGKTAMQVEGLGERTNMWFEAYPSNVAARRGYATGPQLTEEMLSIGKPITDGNIDWRITDVLGEGKFKAISKNSLDRALPEFQKDIQRFLNTGKQSEKLKKYMPQFTETFDISGKIDTSNPIYRFYEKIVGKYLKNKFGATLITDNKGVSWWEVLIKKAMSKEPIEAFGVGALPFIPSLQKEEKNYNKENEPLFITK